MDQPQQQHIIDQLERTISKDRLGTYLTAAGFDKDRALRLYLWNAQVGEAFHLPIQGVEVGLRNGINAGLINRFGPDWWQDETFLAVADRNRQGDVDTARRRIERRHAEVSTPQIIATLSFGFWVGLLQARYHPAIWSAHFKTSFRDLPDVRTRQDLAVAAKRVADLRNRIWHHEPVFRMDLSGEYHAVMELLTWICPIKATWLRPHCRVPQLLRQKP